MDYKFINCLEKVKPEHKVQQSSQRKNLDQGCSLCLKWKRNQKMVR